MTGMAMGVHLEGKKVHMTHKQAGRSYAGHEHL